MSNLSGGKLLASFGLFAHVAPALGVPFVAVMVIPLLRYHSNPCEDGTYASEGDHYCENSSLEV